MNEDAIFAAAMKLAPGKDRDEFLRAACGDDNQLREKIEALLVAHDTPDSFLDEPIVHAPYPSGTFSALEQAGDIIGNYRLLQQIGEGGFGVVYMAEQQVPVQRRVALKIIKPGMDSRIVTARFEAERQALAMMEHPNIAKVLDAGTTQSGRPYFVMELVKGISITKYCDDQRLTLRERLGLFIPVCKAIQHAHQKGIIHRDIKPSNLLVSQYDGEPVPKVIDFGVAKAVHQRLTDKTLFTQCGQVIGTFEYMSPEQAEMNQLDVDTRSDIYSLGAVLYELLTGTTPIQREQLRSAAFDEMLQMIRDREPQRPSLRLSTDKRLAVISTQRTMEPNELPRLVSGELDWIVMKALDKQRARRYETAADFARDVRRYLENQPVEAGPPSVTYRIGKFASRHRMEVVTVIILLSVICLGLIGTTIGMTTARRERDEAQRLAQRNGQLVKQERATRREMERQVRVATSQRLAAQSHVVREAQPVRSLLLSWEAVQLTWQHDRTVTSVALETLLNAVARVGGRPLLGHQEGITAIAIGPDSRWLLTASRDKTARLWDLKSDDPSRASFVLSGHRHPLTAAAISADGNWAMTASGGTARQSGGEALLWNLRQADPSRSPIQLPHAHGVSAAEISLDGRWLVTSSVLGGVRRWDLHARDPSSTAITLGRPGSRLIAVAPHGQWIASDGQGGVRLWNLSSGAIPDAPLLLEKNFSASAIEFSPDGRWFAFDDSDRIPRPRLFDISSGSPVEHGKDLVGHRNGIWSISIGPHGKWLVTGSHDETAILWDLTTENISESRRVLQGQRSGIWVTSIGPAGRWLVTGSMDGVARVWDLHADDPAVTFVELPHHNGRIRATEFSPDGKWLVTAADDVTPRLWQMRRDGPVESPLKLRNGGNELAVSPDGRWLATGGKTKLYLRDMSRGLNSAAPLTVLSGHGHDEYPSGDASTSIAFSPDNRWLAAVSSRNKAARLWDLATGKVMNSPTTFPHKEAPHTLAFSSDLRWLIVGTGDTEASVARARKRGPGMVYLWDLQDKSPAAVPATVLHGHDLPVHLIATGPNGRWLATGAKNGTNVIVWDLAEITPSPRRALLSLPPEAGLRTVGISPNGKWLVAGSIDNNARVWPLSEQGPLPTPMVLEGNTGHIWLVTWSWDSRWLVTGGDGGTLRLWDFSMEDPRLSPIVLRGHGVRSSIRSGAISGDGRWLVTAAWKESPRVWDLKAAEASASMVLNSQSNAPFVVMPRVGNWLATLDLDSTWLWDLDVDRLFRRVQQLAGRKLTEEERKQFSVSSDVTREVRSIVPRTHAAGSASP